MLNQLGEEFKGERNCIGHNMEQYITFSVSIKKECDNNNNNDNINSNSNNNSDNKTVTYKLEFINSFRFMSTSL